MNDIKIMITQEMRKHMKMEIKRFEKENNVFMRNVERMINIAFQKIRKDHEFINLWLEDTDVWVMRELEEINLKQIKKEIEKMKQQKMFVERIEQNMEDKWQEVKQRIDFLEETLLKELKNIKESTDEIDDNSDNREHICMDNLRRKKCKKAKRKHKK